MANGEANMFQQKRLIVLGSTVFTDMEEKEVSDPGKITYSAGKLIRI